MLADYLGALRDILDVELHRKQRASTILGSGLRTQRGAFPSQPRGSLSD